MTVLTTRFPGREPRSLGVPREDGEQIVPVEDLAPGVGQQDPVPVPVEGETAAGAAAADLGPPRLGVLGPAAVVDGPAPAGVEEGRAAPRPSRTGTATPAAAPAERSTTRESPSSLPPSASARIVSRT